MLRIYPSLELGRIGLCFYNLEQGVGLISTRIRMMSSAPVRVRFAPSPTGQLHLGGLRTALYNYLFAKARGGSFILRIEDTDRSRFVPGATENLENILDWIGVKPDESPSKDRERRLELLKREAARTRTSNIYDRRCLSLSEGQIKEKEESGVSYTVRFKLSSITEPVNDLVYGPVVHDVFQFEGDPIILKSDGFPTYHLANVIDDHLMGISHVLRGAEWQVSTPKHVLLYRAFGWNPPEFAHLPLLLNQDGSKLSKRQDDLHILSLRENLYYPESILNFITLVGGGFEDKEYSLRNLFSMQELTTKFQLNRINSNSGKLEMERLGELNQVALRRRFDDPEERRVLIKSCRNLVIQTIPGVQDKFISDECIEKYLLWGLERIKTVKDLVNPDLLYLWTSPQTYETISLTKDTLSKIFEIYENSDDFKGFQKNLRSLCSILGLKFPVVMKDIRVLLTGRKEGPPLLEIIQILGREETLNRFKQYK